MRVNIVAIWNRHYLVAAREQSIEEVGLQKSQTIFFRLTVF